MVWCGLYLASRRRRASIGALKTEVQIDQEPGKLAKIAEMDNPTNMDELAEIGRLAAIKQVKPVHFPDNFDL